MKSDQRKKCKNPPSAKEIVKTKRKGQRFIQKQSFGGVLSNNVRK